MQGKAGQAQAIRDTILREQPVPWQPWSRAAIEAVLPQALQRQHPSTPAPQCPQRPQHPQRAPSGAAPMEGSQSMRA